MIPKLLGSVMDAVKPLASNVSSSSSDKQQLEGQLSPDREHSLQLLLTLAMEMGVEVRELNGKPSNFMVGLTCSNM